MSPPTREDHPAERSNQAGSRADGDAAPEPERARRVTADRLGAQDEPPRPRRARRDTLRGVPRRDLRARVREYVRDVEDRATSSDKKHIQYPALMVRLAVQVVRQWIRDRCPQQAASLAFQTVLSLVPMVAVSLAVLRATGSLTEQSALVSFLSNELIPISQEAISERLLEWSENVTFESLGAVGLITTVILAFIMINSLEKVCNYIWRSERKRSLPQKFVVFYATATVGPALFATGLYEAARVGLTEGVVGFFVSFGTTFVGMFLANYFLPACSVRVKPALWGAVTSTVLFEVSKFGFGAYVTQFALERYQGIYGAVAVAPLLLIWIYYTWLTMLLGFEVAHALQNRHLLERVDRRGPMSLENELLARVNGVTGARVMMAIVRAYLRGDKVLSRRRLEIQFELSDEVLTRITKRLKERDLIIEVEGELNGFLPARPPAEISLASVLRAFRGEDVIGDDDRPGEASKLDKVLTDIEADTLQRTGHLYLDQLV